MGNTKNRVLHIAAGFVTGILLTTLGFTFGPFQGKDQSETVAQSRNTTVQSGTHANTTRPNH